jgi:polymorphic toxin system DSP-PTPase phosphatase-like protein
MSAIGAGGLLPVADAVSSDAPWLWWALTGTARLAGMSAPPDGFPFSFLRERGLDVIVSLIGPGSYDPAPLESRAHKLQDLAGGAVPDDAAAEEREVRRAAAAITSVLEQGRGVAVHCRMGVGRTGLVIGSVLVAAGHDPAAVTSWLDAVQRRRGVRGWPESPWQADLLTSFSPGG